MPKGRASTFKDIIEKRLDEQELQRLDNAAKLEVEFSASLQKQIAKAISDYMTNNNIGFNQMADNILCIDRCNLTRILTCKGGTTLSGLAHIAAGLGLKTHIIFEKI